MLLPLMASLAIQQTTTPQAVSALPADFKKWPLVYVVYDSQTERPNIHTANGDGSAAKQVAKDGMNPVWSPDRKQIAFVRMRGVWVMNANGTEQKNVYSSNGEDSKIVGLSWGKTPNDATSESLLFGVYAQNQTEIYRSQKKGKEFETAKMESVGLTWFGVTERAYPAVSSTGKTLAFTANGDLWMSLYDEDQWRTGRLAAVAVYDLSSRGGSNATAVARHLSWVPNSRKIVYSFQRMWGSGVEEVWIADFTKARDPILNSENVVRKKLADKVIEPCVSPDGKWILATRLYDWDGLVAISIDGAKTLRVLPKGEQANW